MGLMGAFVLLKMSSPENLSLFNLSLDFTSLSILANFSFSSFSNLAFSSFDLSLLFSLLLLWWVEVEGCEGLLVSSSPAPPSLEVVGVEGAGGGRGGRGMARCVSPPPGPPPPSSPGLLPGAPRPGEKGRQPEGEARLRASMASWGGGGVLGPRREGVVAGGGEGEALGERGEVATGGAPGGWGEVAAGSVGGAASSPSSPSLSLSSGLSLKSPSSWASSSAFIRSSWVRSSPLALPPSPSLPEASWGGAGGAGGVLEGGGSVPKGGGGGVEGGGGGALLGCGGEISPKSVSDMELILASPPLSD